MKPRLQLLSFVLFVTLFVALPLQAQIAATGAQSEIDSLATLPEFDAVVYVNTFRILKEAMPRLLPEKELKELNTSIDQLKTFTTVDLRRMEQVIVVARFNRLAAGMTFPAPDAMIVARGDFDAKTLIGAATLMSDGKLREEKYGTHSLYLFTFTDPSKKTNPNPFEAAFSEMAIASLDTSTLAIGNTSYIKAALDAADGRGRIKPETLSSLVRDTNALISTSGSPLMAIAKTLGLRIVENPDPNCMTRFGEYYLSLTMGDGGFKINGALNADNPDTATLVKSLLTGLVKEGKDNVPEKSAKSMFDQVKLSTEGNEVLAEATIPEDMAAKFVRDMLAPKPATKTSATETKKVTKRRTKSGKSRSRT